MIASRIGRSIVLAAFVIAAMLTPSAASSAPGQAAGFALEKQRAIVEDVTDGDTIEVSIGNRQEFVRFIGIDTPEVYPEVDCGGPQASASMERMLEPGDQVRLVRDRSQGNRDSYERLLRYVEFEGRDLGRKQVTKGWASVYVFDRRFKRLDPYERAERRARAGDRGVWGDCGGF